VAGLGSRVAQAPGSVRPFAAASIIDLGWSLTRAIGTNKLTLLQSQLDGYPDYLLKKTSVEKS
jgi:hypothetical protein